jgi:hypothetical protein
LLEHGASGPGTQVLKDSKLTGLRYARLLVGPREKLGAERERLEEFCHGEPPRDLECSIPNASAQAVSTFVNQDIPGDMDYFNLTTMEELHPL